jgi:hypothetical protein
MKARSSSCCFDTIEPTPLDTVRNSAYTTEFLDGPEKLVERDHCEMSGKRGTHS